MEFDYSNEVILENENVRLRPLRKSDTESLTPLARDPVIWEYLLEDGSTKERLHNYILEAVGERHNQVSYPFLVIDRRNDQVAGTTRLYEINLKLGNLKIGHTWYGSEFRGTGINAQVKQLLFEYVFRQLGAKRVGFGVHENNLRSMAALRKIGAEKDGVLRDFLPDVVNGSHERFDVILFSILHEEWANGIRIEKD